MQVSVVIPFTPQSHQISRLLKNLELQQGVDFEVIGVFNPHTSAMPKIPDLKFPYIQLSSPKGANWARNTGLKKAKADIVVFLDADCIPIHSRFLQNYYDTLQSQPELTGVGGYYKLDSHQSLESKTYHYLQTRWIQEGIINAQRDCRNLLGGNLALRVSKLSGESFDEELIFGGTEREFLQRLQIKGHKFKLIPSQEVWHSVDVGSLGLIKKAFAQGKGARYIFEKWGAERNSTLNLRVSSPSDELRGSLYLYNLFFELGFKKTITYQAKKLWNSGLLCLIETFSIARKAQSIKERRES